MQTETHETPKGKTRYTRLLVLGAIVLLALVIFVPPYINVNSLRHSIVQSIGAGLGRPVYASSVELKLFPRPAFVLHHLTVAAEPEFGAEPVLTAESVTASLRASTLWHRRVEIASLHFDAPSVNLVRNDSGQWNFSSLIRNSHILRQPGAASSNRPLPFPYVEATGARINFKLGPEKLPFLLESADLAFWKESDGRWHVRIKASPVRTDLTLADTGQIRGEAVVATSADLMNAPIHVSLEWRKVQLGEFSRLLHGTDSGWRGMVDWTVSAQGTLAKLSAASDIHVDEFRRAEFVPPSEMDLSAHCQAQISKTDRLLNSLKCDVPAGGGHVLLQGNLRSPTQLEDLHNPHPMARLSPGSAAPASMRLMVQHVSAGFFMDMFRHTHPGVVAGATASGEVNGVADCDWIGLDRLHACKGELRATPLTLNLPHLEHPLHLSPLLLTTSPAEDLKTAGTSIHSRLAKSAKEKPAIAWPMVPRSIWNLAPVHVALGGTTPATVTGMLTTDGPTIKITGTADLSTLYKLATALNFPAVPSGIRSIRGSAELALSLESTWLPVLTTNRDATHSADIPIRTTGQVAPSQWSGGIQIHNATLQMALFPGTIDIASGQVRLSQDAVDWTGVTGSYAHIPLSGSIHWQIVCAAPGPGCERSFRLHTSNLNIERLQAALHRDSDDSSFLERINPWSGGMPKMPGISGIFDADVLTAGKLSLKNASLQISLLDRHADLHAISGTLFGGTIYGIPVVPPVGIRNRFGGGPGGSAQVVEPVVGSMQWGDGAPSYMLQAKVEGIRPEDVAAIWHERWGTGTATVEIRLKTRGWSAVQLAQNASGNFGIIWKDGSFAAPPVGRSGLSSSSGADGVTRFQHLVAAGTIQNQTLVLDSGRMEFHASNARHRSTGLATQSLSGTVKFSRVLDLRLQPSGDSITGTLNSPVLKTKPSRTPTHTANGNALF